MLSIHFYTFNLTHISSFDAIIVGSLGSSVMRGGGDTPPPNSSSTANPIGLIIPYYLKDAKM
jgi:hypothetical protein